MVVHTICRNITLAKDGVVSGYTKRENIDRKLASHSDTTPEAAV